MSEERYQGDEDFLEWQKERARRVVKNEQTFRDYNERREQFEKQASWDEPVPFVCECADVDCWGVMELTVDEFEDAHKRDDHFSVISGHVMPEFEKVVEQHDRYWVVAKFTPDQVTQRLVTDDQQ